MRISDWSSDVCSSDLRPGSGLRTRDDGGDDGSYLSILALRSTGTAGAAIFSGAAGRKRRGQSGNRPARISDATRSASEAGDRKSVVEGKRVAVRVDLGGRRTIKKNNEPKERRLNRQRSRMRNDKRSKSFIK